MNKIYHSLVIIMASFSVQAQQIEKCTDNKVNITKNEVTCFSGNDGKIIVSVTSPEIKSYQLVNISENKTVRDFTSDKVFSFLTSASYRLIAKDTTNKVCYSDIDITQPALLKFTSQNIAVNNKPAKDKKDGSITVDFSGGTAPFNIKINSTDKSIDTIFSGNTSQSKVIDHLKSGIYTITISDVNKCQTKEVQFEILPKDNFGFKITQNDRTCNKDPEFKITFIEGKPPYNIRVSLNEDQLEAQPAYTLNEYTLPIAKNKFGIYSLTIQDIRNSPQTFSYNSQEIDCKLNVSTVNISPAKIENTTDGKIQIMINNGNPPFLIKCIDNTTKISFSDTKSENRNHQFSNLKEGNYSIIVEDLYGRKFDGLVSVPTQHIQADIAKKDFLDQKQKFSRLLKTCECHKDRLENWRKGIRVSVAIVGLAGTIASAGAGTLVGGIISGVVTTSGTLTNEYVSDKKIDVLKSNFTKLKEIEVLFNSFSTTEFENNNWDTKRVIEYYSLIKSINAELGKLNKDFDAKCKESKLTEKYSLK